jgi:hypothetical protein
MKSRMQNNDDSQMTNGNGRVTCNALPLRIVKLITPDFRILFNHKLNFTPHKILRPSRFFKYSFGLHLKVKSVARKLIHPCGQRKTLYPTV